MDKRFLLKIRVFIAVLFLSVNAHAITLFQSSSDLDQDLFPSFSASASWLSQHQSLIIEITNHSNTHYLTQFSLKRNPLFSFNNFAPISAYDQWTSTSASSRATYVNFTHAQSTKSEQLGIPPGQTRAFKLTHWSTYLNRVDLKDAAAVEEFLFNDEGSAWISSTFYDYETGVTHQAYATKLNSAPYYKVTSRHTQLPGSIGLLLCALFCLYLYSKPCQRQNKNGWPLVYGH